MRDFYLEHQGTHYVVGANSKEEAVAKFESSIRGTTLEKVGRNVSVPEYYRGMARGAAVEAPPEIAGVGGYLAGALAEKTGIKQAIKHFSGVEVPKASELMPEWRESAQGLVDERAPEWLQREPAGVSDRLGQELGRGAAWATAALPVAAALPGGAFSGAGMAAEGASLLGPLAGQLQREIGAPEGLATATDIGMGVIAPAAVGPMVARRSGQALAREAVRGTTGQRVSGRVARGAARQVQADVGEAFIPRARAALDQGMQDFADPDFIGPRPPAGMGYNPHDAPLPGQILAGADVPGSTTMDRTKLMLGDPEFQAQAANRVDRARRRTHILEGELEPAGDPEAYGPAWRDLAGRRKSEASAAYEALPMDRRSVEQDRLSRTLNRLMSRNRTVMSQRKAEEFIGPYIEDFNEIFEMYPHGFVPTDEIVDWMTNLKGELVSPMTDPTKKRYLGELYDALGTVYEETLERSAAGAQYRDMKRTFSPKRPKDATVQTDIEELTINKSVEEISRATDLAKKLLKPTGGANPYDVARRLRTVLADEPEMLQMVKSSYWDNLYRDTTGKARSAKAFQDRLNNPKFREIFQQAFDDPHGTEWREFYRLALMRRQTEWGNIGKAALAEGTGSGPLARAGVDVLQAARGSVDAWARLGAKLLRSRYGNTKTAQLFKAAHLDPELFEVMLSLGRLEPDPWISRVSEIAARHGITSWQGE